MSLLTLAKMRAQVETDYDDTTLQSVIDSVEIMIDKYIGPSTGYVSEQDDTDMLTVIYLPVDAASITSIVEYTGTESEPTKTTLAADDYELSVGGDQVRRLSDGTNPRTKWGWSAVITFDPVGISAQRKQAAIKLGRLEIEHGAYETERIGDWGSTEKDIKAERNKILQELDNDIF